jgi:SAM-dependent methyltransferase
MLKDRLAGLLPTPFRAYLATRTGAYRAFVGPADTYDLSGASQFNLLTLCGLRDTQSLLDIGCGSLRAGRLFIAYLQPGGYFGIEPEKWLVEAAIQKEIGQDLITIKKPTFDHNRNFNLTVFQRQFDFLLANSIFSHAPPTQTQTCLQAAQQVMKPESYFLATVVLGATDHNGSNWVYPERVTCKIETLNEWAIEYGLTCELLDWPYVYGTGDQHWLAFSKIKT